VAGHSRQLHAGHGIANGKAAEAFGHQQLAAPFQKLNSKNRSLSCPSCQRRSSVAASSAGLHRCEHRPERSWKLPSCQWRVVGRFGDVLNGRTTSIVRRMRRLIGFDFLSLDLTMRGQQ
jgi:hypothetical protein